MDLTRHANTPVHPKYRPDIDGLRAIAVLSVVAFHAFPSRIKGGFVGVDMFFVISGYLISTIIANGLARGDFSFTGFYVRRIKRIFPALLLVLGACFAVGWSTLLADDYARMGEHIAAGAGFVSNLLLWSESGYFDSDATRKPLLHLWSLGIEEQFYIVWPFILWAASKKKVSFLAITLTIAIASFALCIARIHDDPVGTFYSPLTRFWELLIGAILAIAAPKFAHRLGSENPDQKNAATIRNTLSILGFSLIVASIAATSDSREFPGWWALPPTFGALLLIASGTHAWVNRRILSNRALVAIGLISFPLYLWHWPLLYFARVLSTGEPSNWLRAGVIVLSIALAWATYQFIEKPVRFGGYGLPKAAALVFLMIMIGGAGYDSFDRQGLQFRKVIKEQSAFISDLSKITNVYRYFNVNSEWRYGTCFAGIEGGTSPAQEQEKCVEKTHPLVFIWGDSFAATLYPGLKTLQKSDGHRFGIAEMTDPNTPPFFDSNKLSGNKVQPRKTLLELNDEKLKVVAATKPAVVLLAWMYEGTSGITDEHQLVAAIKDTAERIHAVSPETKVAMIGPFPEWDGGLKEALIAYAHEHQGNLPPVYSNFRSTERTKAWDVYLGRDLPPLGITYISSQNALCNASGCLTRVSDTPLGLTAVDWGHLSPAGSTFLMNKIKSQLFALIDPVS